MPWKVRVKKKFQAAHYLTDYPKEGEREPLHGHTWEVECVFRVEKLNKAGIDIDFVEVDRFLEQVLPNYKCLNEVYEFSPSAENLAKYLYEVIKKKFPQLERVVVWETENCGAEYFEEF